MHHLWAILLALSFCAKPGLGVILFDLKRNNDELNKQEESVRPTLSKRQWDTESLLDDFCSRHHAATFVSLKFTRPLCTPAYRSCVLFCLKLQENVTSCLDTCTHRRQTLTPLLKGQDNKRMSSPVTDCGTANCHHLRNTDNYGDCLISVCLRER